MKTLIVDRVKVFQQIIAGILDDTEIEHVFAATGKDALELLSRDESFEEGRFDCICLALYLDDMDGFELCKHIRKISVYRHVPVVLLTSESSQDVISKALTAGITDIFAKNKIHELVNFIERFTQVKKPIEGRILYIEDQKSQRELVTQMFRERKLDVDAFDNANDAWKAFVKNYYHVVVTDIVLVGEVSGILLINKIRRLEGAKGDVPILALTAFDDNSRRISLYHMGITDYVTKPIIEEEMIARVRNLVSHQKSMEREAQFRQHLNSEEMVQRSLKMEAIGKLTGGIAHDYNNMLSVILGYTDLLKRKLAGDEKLMNYVSQIDKAGKNGMRLTSKLLSFTKREAADAEVIDINQLIEDELPMLEKLLTAGIRLETTLEEDIWRIKVDANDLENAIINLTINARHAMGEQGALTIVTMNKKLSGGVADRVGLPPGEYVRLSILDTGCGMEKEVVDRIFDPFFSTKGEGGTGLGLSQVYGFVQRSKAGIAVESKPGKGTLFSIFFPRETAELSASAELSSEDNLMVSEGTCSVLVVDDDADVAELNAELLEMAGYKTDIAHDAADALMMLGKNHYDVLLSDVVMPGINGFELAKKVRKKMPAIKIVMMTGYDEKAREDVGDDVDFDSRLEKPVDRISLLGTISRLLRG